MDCGVASRTSLEVTGKRKVHIKSTRSRPNKLNGNSGKQNQHQLTWRNSSGRWAVPRGDVNVDVGFELHPREELGNLPEPGRTLCCGIDAAGKRSNSMNNKG